MCRDGTPASSLFPSADGRSPARFAGLNEWLARLEGLDPAKIVLGLERVRRVLTGMNLGRAPFKVVTVAGTNGKGSSVAMLESILTATGYRCGAYYSPHLVRYNERVRVCGREVSDEALCRAFERVEAARGDVPLTYFEFGTLAALQVFHTAGLDVVVLEVGLGGRLDAVNVVDSDVALITGIDVDHCQWLGEDREQIGAEKAGIMRPGRPAVCSDPNPPGSVMRHARETGARLACIGRDFGYASHGATWSWWGDAQRHRLLPAPALAGAVQLQNAAGVLMVLEHLRQHFPRVRGALGRGLASVRLAGRLQALPGPPPRILDVAHNPHAARVLAEALRQLPCGGRSHGVLGMLKDKDMAGVMQAMAGVVDVWHLATLDVPRGATSRMLAGHVAGNATAVSQYPNPHCAYATACETALADDRIIVFGSFYTVAAALSIENGPRMTNTSTVQV